MLIAVVTLASMAPAIAAQSNPQGTPPPVIGHVRATLLCSGLRNRIGPSIEGLQVNDKIISQGQTMMAKLRSDAVDDPRSDSGTGGAGSSSEMDDFEMTALVQALSRNLAKVETLLNDAEIFPPQAVDDDERALNLARSRLAAVVADQRNVLNLLAITLASNQGNDLRSKCDPVDCPAGGTTPARLSLPRALADAIQEEHSVESAVAPAIVALVRRCLQKT